MQIEYKKLKEKEDQDKRRDEELKFMEDERRIELEYKNRTPSLEPRVQDFDDKPLPVNV